jgi:malate dehydrogenase
VKISIIGSGKVGSSIAFSLLHTIKPNELVLVDIIKSLVDAEAFDLAHASVSLSPKTKIFGTTNIFEIKNSNFIIITAGKPRTNETSRNQLFLINKPIIVKICKTVSEIAPNAFVIIVTNPATKLANVAKQFCNNVIAMDNQLDTARLKYNINKLTKQPFDKINSYVYGEHSECMKFKILDKITKEQTEQVKQETRFASKPILKGKGNTCWGIASQVVKEIKKHI